MAEQTVRDYAVGVGVLATLILISVACFGVFALIAWALWTSWSLLLTPAGAIAVVVVASLVWQQMRGRD